MTTYLNTLVAESKALLYIFVYLNVPNQPLDGKLYYAGETYNANQECSTVSGAILSGYDVVNTMLEE